MENEMNEHAVLAPAVTPPGKKITEEERLTIENAYLKIQNLQMTVQAHDTAKAQCIEQMRALQKQMEEYRDTLSKKYGVDISRTTVTPTGEIKG